MNWRHWFELVYRSSNLPTIAAVVAGFIATTAVLQRSIKRLRLQIKSQGDDLKGQINVSRPVVEPTLQTNSELQKQLQGFADSIDSLKNQHHSMFEELRNELKLPKSNGDTVPPPNSETEESSPSVFPISVQDYLQRVQDQKLESVIARSEVLRAGSLVPTGSDDGDFVVVFQGAGNDDIAVPRIGRFSSNEELGYYRNYFDCDAPASGEVRITEPAIVRKDDDGGGWRVVTKGRLELG